MTEPENQPATPAAEPTPPSYEQVLPTPASEPIAPVPAEPVALPVPPVFANPVTPSVSAPPAHDPFAQPATPAYPAQVYPAQVYPAQVYPAQPDSTQQYPAQPYPGQPVVLGDPAYAAGYPGAPEPPKKSKAVKIVAIVLGIAFVLCAGGGLGAFFLLRNTEGKGATTASDAAEVFVEAVYEDYDVVAADKITCEGARDRKALQAKIDAIKTELAKFKGASLDISNPKISDETATQANATVTIKITTSDEKESEQKLKLILAKHEGWFVCEVTQG